MKIRTILFALIAVVVVAGIGVGVLMGKVDGWRPRIQAELQDKLNRPVSIGHISLKLLPLELKIDSFSIGEAAGFPQERPFATASTVFVSASLFSLLRGSPEVKDLTLDKPQIELIRNAAGVWNYSSLGKSGSSSSSSSETKLSLRLLELTDGQIGYTDQLNKQPRSVYDHIDLRVSDFAPNKQFGLHLGVHFPGTGKQTLAFTGKAGPLNVATENALPPVNGHLSIEEVSLAAVNQFASGTLPPDTNSTASGEADINSLADVLGCKGNLKLDNTILNGAKMDYAITSTYNLEDDFKQKKLLIRSGVLQLGPTTFSVSGDVNTAATPVVLNVALKTDHSSITELAKLAGGLGFGFSPAYNVAGKVSADVTAKGPASSPQLNGTIQAQGLSASGGEIKQAVSIPEIDLKLSPDSITSNSFSATSGSTSLTIAFTLMQYATTNRSIDASVKTNGANVSELLNIAKTYGLDGAQGVSGDGKLTLDVYVKGPLANASALAYSGTANIANATLATPALKKALTIASANAAFSQNSVSLDNLAATLGGSTVRGTLSAKNFAAPELAFNLNADKIDTDELENITNPAPPNKSATKKAKAETPSLLLVTTGSGALTAGMIKANDIVLRNVNTKCQLNKGLIELSPLSAEVFGGKANGTLTADMRPTPATAAVKIKLAGADANALLSAVSPMKDRVSGTLAADTNVRCAMVSSNDLPRTLNGTFSFNLTNGVIRNIDILGAVSKIGKLAGNNDSANGGTTVKKFAGTLNIVNGVANTQDLTGELTQGTVTAKGDLNLVTQDVNMHLTASLGSASAGQPAGGGLLNTVLATAKGQLMVPVIITGNLAHPSVAPDLQEMAKLKLSNLGGGTKGAVGGVLGGILGGQAQDGKTKKPANPVGSLLDQFTKKK
jgi:uncharacterized protein involved in outer membrane biogenesis